MSELRSYVLPPFQAKPRPTPVVPAQTSAYGRDAAVSRAQAAGEAPKQAGPIPRFKPSRHRDVAAD